VGATEASATATMSGPTARTCSTSLSRFRPDAPSAVIRDRSGSAATTSSVSTPMEPVDQSTETVITAAGSERPDRDGQPEHRRKNEQQAVETVEQPTVAGQNRTHVLDAQIPLEQGLGEITERGGGRGPEAEEKNGGEPGPWSEADDADGD